MTAFNPDELQVKKKGKCEIFFGYYLNNFVRKFRWIIIIVFLGWGGIAAYYASKLTPLTKEDKLLDDDHVLNII